MKSALLHKCETLEDLHQKTIYVITCMEQCGMPQFPCSAVRAWFDNHSRMMSLFSLAPYSPILNPIEEFSWAWRWKVFDYRPYGCPPNVPTGRNWCCVPRHHHWTLPGRIRHTKRFFPRCLAREDIRCDVDENMWPNAEDQAD